MRQLWLGGLLIALALFGHDFLMAAATRAAPEAAAMAHEHGVPDRVAKAGDGMTDREPGPGHPTLCDTTGQAIPTSSLQFDAPDVWIPVVSFGRDNLASPPTVAWCWAEPLWPPGTRRALLQVYRV